MLHNGIEYGLMQAFAEGFAMLERKREFQLDLLQIAEIWRDGSVEKSGPMSETRARGDGR
jgi:6-phosphogluconate dehydrogenase